MTPRERFFNLVENSGSRDLPFFPDLTDWYMARRINPGEAFPYAPGQFIPDDSPLHARNHDMPEELAGLTFLDLFKKFGWGCPIHCYEWFEPQYTAPVRRECVTQGHTRTTRLIASRGELVKVERLCDDGSWAPAEHFVKAVADLEIMREVVEHTRFVARYDRAQAVLDALGGQGVIDLPVMRSPFGKLVHEYMGLERVAFALFDQPEALESFLAFQEQKDLEQVRLAAHCLGRVVILSDHADENLLAPPWFEQYCMPYYEKACRILHESGKLVSTHWDGNHKSLFQFLPRLPFDILDGCTPKPMNNYEVEELAEALPARMRAWVGVPSTLFCTGEPTADILAYADRIHRVFSGRAIINVGDILPPNGDFSQVIALGEQVARLNGEG
ncbi:hypothetical protein LLH00_13865 [bacterium]|nr:hypothetical protein [bacterium]